jgi:glycerol-3-phosphate dehydrogenase
MNRQKNIEKLQVEKFDLAIVGGGITGAGIARDAASRGLKVAMVEASDFASGTSCRSSKLIHGGIRYLENYEFGLVFEALSERHRLFSIAPHLVYPLRFAIPLYKGDRVGMFLMGMGMLLYDVLALFRSPKLHRRLSREDLLSNFPVLKKEGLLGGYEYSDAFMDDDRLTIETVRSAIDLGARCANYVKATGCVMENDKITKLHCQDVLTQQEFMVEAKTFVSAVGPWTDVFAASVLPDWKPKLRPSKGIHITLKKDRIPLKSAVVMAASEDGRVVFAIPRPDMIIVGTTDTDYKEDPGEIRTTVDDVRYLFRIVNEFFPGAKLTADDVIASYAGVRPLVDDGAESEGKTSREHTIIHDPRNITFISGGKYTTYRNMAEQLVDEVLQKRFSFSERTEFANSNTKCPLNPLADEESFEQSLERVKMWADEFDWEQEDVDLLVKRHAGEALELIKTAGPQQGRSVWCIEAQKAIHDTMCVKLLDFYLRRTPLFLALEDHGTKLLGPIADVFSQELGWDGAKTEQEKRSVRDYIDHELAWKQEL